MNDFAFVIADVFAETPFAGNQLAVFIDARGLSDGQMQRAANEMNFSETTFVLPPETPDADLRLRIFTPHVELPFAGHPLVGSGFVAAVKGLVPCAPSVIRFETGVGVIDVSIEIESNLSGRATMRQPVPEFVSELVDGENSAHVASALGVSRGQIASELSPIAIVDNGLPLMIVPLDGLASVRALNPNQHSLRHLAETHSVKTILAFTTETVHPDSSVHCRVYAPGAGVHEDPATGSANGPLGAYLLRYGRVTSGEIVSEQGYEMGRPSTLMVNVERADDGGISSVHVGGGVFVVADGTMHFEGGL
ncbi:MAG: PhzF family phenazine biosynthesis protein [Blastocatellia bacterium]|jgi:trans-2,3-dihydro-3-hydroxyanthranilate isomerase|nr:PhzF family phenazine biosynthesis protein [Blastocatellia bacterium]